MEILDHIFDVLSEERRRYALYYLEQQDSPVPIDEVVEQIAEWETNGAAEYIPEEKFDRIELEFYHQDLPKTSDLQYLWYDRETERIELTGAPPEVDAIISIAKVIERPDRNP